LIDASVHRRVPPCRTLRWPDIDSPWAEDTGAAAASRASRQPGPRPAYRERGPGV